MRRADVERVNVVATAAEQSGHARKHAELVFHENRNGVLHKNRLERTESLATRTNTVNRQFRRFYICSTVSMPSVSSPCFKTRAVRSHNARRESRVTPSDFSTGQFS